MSGRERPPSRVVAGVDEAGLGPLLGPLTLGYSVFRLPEPAADPWRLLRGTVARRPSRRAKLVVADSKRVFTRNPTGLRRLEATVLGFATLLAEGTHTPRDPRAFLFGRLAPGADGLAPADALLKRHPWYDALPALPRAHDAEALELTAALLGRRLGREGMQLLDAGVRVVPAGELNASFAKTNNKGQSVWERCNEVLTHLWRRHGEADPDVTVDILGGRIHYAGLLRRGFPDADVRVLFEGPEHSAYVLTEKEEQARGRWLPRRMRLDFRAKGEDHSFAVALASCFAKYARELVMEAFNAYFAAFAPSLVPTAGYTTDGRRWLADAGSAIERAGLAREVLARTR